MQVNAFSQKMGFVVEHRDKTTDLKKQKILRMASETLLIITFTTKNLMNLV